MQIFSTCNSIKNETPTQTNFSEFWEIFRLSTLSRTNIRHRCFLVFFDKFLRIIILQKICEGLRNMIIARFFCETFYSLKWKIKVYTKYLLLNNVYISFFNVLPCWDLLVQSQQWKHQNNVWKLFKFNSKDTRTTSFLSFWCLYC